MNIVLLIFICGMCLLFPAYVLLMLALIRSWLAMPVENAGSQMRRLRLSVLIPARNEEANITNCLESLASQNYPSVDLEVIVIDDCSEDRTADLVLAFIAKGSIRNLKLISLEPDLKTFAHKKRALTAGVTESSGELIITTDADCVAGPEWLKEMAACYLRTAASLILGPVAFHRGKGFFGAMQSLEFAGLLAVTGAAAFAKRPLMCNGASLAYPKTVFEAVQGYKDDEEPSGDDVLLMNKVQALFPGKIHFLKSKAALVFTRPQQSLRNFMQQRRRWASKFRQYGGGRVAAVAVLVFLSNLFLIAGGVICVFVPAFRGIYLILAGAKLIIDFLILFLATSFTGNKSLLWIYLPEVFFYSFYVVLSGLGVKSGYEWKGRRIR
jgi:cellulose synthase/poly-beta-1,6-N-acetylglucosamine synthase-like glycosyltransferase